MNNLKQEAGFMEDQKGKTSKSIVSVQKELSEIIDLN
jgi:hypothetical protein